VLVHGGCYKVVPLLLVLAALQANALIVAGQWWRLLSPAFLHGSVAHLAMNSYSLNNLGPAVESKTG
jgi:membrane associated rhomboid family serine protease